jgi:putative iron-dependent peroxidase
VDYAEAGRVRDYRPVATAQFGIFAIGTSAHCYLEFDLRPGVTPAELTKAVAELEEPHSTVGGANLVIGYRPELWAAVSSDVAPGVTSFTEPIVGPGRFTMPATQHDLWLWIAGSANDLVFDQAVEMITALDGVAGLATEVTGWSYRHSRDLTGFEDGTENPPLAEAASIACVPAGSPGAGSSVLLVQQWKHDGVGWMQLPDGAQENVIGRTKPGSVELAEGVMPIDSHVARTKVYDEAGEELDIFRRNAPYGTVSDHGTMFVGFSRDQERLGRMLEQMAGVTDGVRDALTRYTTPLTGAYYVVPSVEALNAVAPPG